jgi:hypothetical protein
MTKKVSKNDFEKALLERINKEIDIKRNSLPFNLNWRDAVDILKLYYRVLDDILDDDYAVTAEKIKGFFSDDQFIAELGELEHFSGEQARDELFEDILVAGDIAMEVFTSFE